MSQTEHQPNKKLAGIVAQYEKVVMREGSAALVSETVRASQEQFTAAVMAAIISEEITLEDILAYFSKRIILDKMS